MTSAVRRPDPATPDVAALLDRYDELAALLASIPERGLGEPDATVRAAAYVAREARLLDAGHFEAWLDLHTDDVVVWVPLDPASHPGGDQSLYLDDRRRLAERIRWRRDPSAWGQQPPSQCVRAVSGVEAWSGAGRIVVSSTVVIHEQRHGRSQLLVGRQVHELVGDGSRCRTKILVLPTLADGVRNPSFLL